MNTKKTPKSPVRQREAFSLEDLMPHFIKENNLEKGFQKISIEETWEQIMGAGVQSYTQAVVLRGTTLTVKLSSAALREQLSYGKEKIVVMMNDAIGKELIKKVVLS